MTTPRSANVAGPVDDTVDGTVDGRSVAELLLDADLTARAALWDPEPAHATARIRTWGEVVEAAADLWSAIPDRTGDPSMRRILGLTQAQHRTRLRSGWPGPGPADPHLESVATTLARAAELVTARPAPSAPRTAATTADADAARTRLMHVLYVAAHGVDVALAGHVRDLQHHLADRKKPAAGISVEQARAAQRRIGAVERLAGSYLDTRWPGALHGEHREPTEIPRLEHALAQWDLAAHRALAGPPTLANLAVLARVQQHVTGAAGIIGAAATSRGLRDPEEHTRLHHTVTHLGHAWGVLGADLHQLVGRQRRLNPQLLLAGNEVQAALREITHDRAGLATPQVMASRVDLAAATAALHRGLAASVDLAHVVRDALTGPQLTVAARGAQAIATTYAPDTEGAWVGIGDFHHNRDIGLPEPARALLTRHAEEVIRHAVAADSATGAARLPAAPTPTHRQPNGRAHQDRAHPDPGTRQAPTIGCER